MVEGKSAGNDKTWNAWHLDWLTLICLVAPAEKTADTRHQNLHNTMFLWTWAKQLPKLDAFDYLRAQKQFEAHFSGYYMKSNTVTKCAHGIRTFTRGDGSDHLGSSGY